MKPINVWVSPEFAYPASKKAPEAIGPSARFPQDAPFQRSRVLFEDTRPGCGVVWTCMRRRCPPYAFERCSEKCDGVLGWPW
jgi:hypothetical protein